MAFSAWLAQMGHACFWGSVGIVVVGAACRLLPRLPAGVRAWLWWLACAKLLLRLGVAAPITLAVLPAPSAPPVITASAPAVPKTASAVPTKRRAWASAAAPMADTAPALPRPAAFPWPECLFALWLLGVGVSVMRLACQNVRLTRMQRGTHAACLPAADLDALARQMGLKGAPRVRTGPNVPTPCIAGCLRPAILLPRGFADALTPGELRLTLAHEMAHLRRGDLPLAIVPALAQALFFFHPLAWWAAAEWAAAREEACDALALSATGAPRADYGRLLLKLAAPAASAPALGLSPGYASLRRRLTRLASARPAPRSARYLALALPLLLPWRLSAALPRAGVPDTPPARYAVTPLAGGADAAVAGLSDAGQAAFSADTQGYVGGTDAADPLGALPKHRLSLAYAVNKAGQAAGASFNLLGHARAFVWDGAARKIGSLPGYPYSEARGLGDDGTVAGFAEAGRPDRLHAWIARAFVRPPGGALVDLGTLGGPYSAAYAVSADGGSVAGKADTPNGSTHAFLWTEAGGMTDLGTLGGANSAAYAVSPAGIAVGVSETETPGIRHGFVSENSQMRDLPPLPGFRGSAALAVNRLGQIVGMSQAADGAAKRATLWQGGTPTDLNTLLPPGSGWVLTEARAVNMRGQIAGQGLWNGKPCAFLLTPR